MNIIRKTILILFLCTISYTSLHAIAEIGEIREKFGTKENCNSLKKDIEKRENKRKRTYKQAEELNALHKNYNKECREKK